MDMPNVAFNRQNEFIIFVNRLLSLCLSDPTDKTELKFVMTQATDDPEWDINDLRDDNHVSTDIPITHFALKRTDLDEYASSIVIYVKIIKNSSRIHYGMHSLDTPKKYENRKYNQILRALFILSSNFVTVDGRPVTHLGSWTENPISAYLWESKFQVYPSSELVCKRLIKFSYFGDIFEKVRKALILLFLITKRLKLHNMQPNKMFAIPKEFIDNYDPLIEKARVNTQDRQYDRMIHAIDFIQNSETHIKMQEQIEQYNSEFKNEFQQRGIAPMNDYRDFFKLYADCELDDIMITVRGLRRFREWDYLYSFDKYGHEFTHIAEVTPELRKNAYNHLVLLLSETIGNCKRGDIQNNYESEFTLSKYE